VDTAFSILVGKNGEVHPNRPMKIRGEQSANGREAHAERARRKISVEKKQPSSSLRFWAQSSAGLPGQIKGFWGSCYAT